MRDYTKIEAWKLADDLTVAVYQATQSFPREEIWLPPWRIQARNTISAA
jgi:hypothetical protein